METILLCTVVAVIVVVFAILNSAGSQKDWDDSVVPKIPKFGPKPKRIKQTINPNEDKTYQPNFTKEQFAFLIKANGLYLITNDMLDEHPCLSNCHVSDGITCLSSAALWCLYVISYGQEQNRRRLQRLHIRILISFPEISEAAKRALKYYGDFASEKYDGLLHIAGDDAFTADLFIIAQWLYTELSLNDVENYSEQILKKLVNQLRLWFFRLPDVDWISDIDNA